MLDGLRLVIDNLGLQIVDIGAGRGQEVVDVRIATENTQNCGPLGPRTSALSPHIIWVEPCRTGQGLLDHILVGVPDHINERELLEHHRILDDLLDHALLEHITRELCGLRKRECH
jgi:hypothetical protein